MDSNSVDGNDNCLIVSKLKPSKEEKPLYMTIMKPVDEPSPGRKRMIKRPFYPHSRTFYGKGSSQGKNGNMLYLGAKSGQSILLNNNSSEEESVGKEFD